MRAPSFKEYSQKDGLWDKYVDDKQTDFTDYVLNEAENYTETLDIEDWDMTQFLEDAGSEWSYMDYNEWLESEYGNLLADIGDQKREQTRDEH